MTYRPHQVDQLDGSRYAGTNCTCASAAMALDRHTTGGTRTTASRVRTLTGDTSGGTNLRQNEAALIKGWNVDLDLRLPTTWPDFCFRLDMGQGAILQGASSATHGTIYSASETFRGNHAWFVNERRRLSVKGNRVTQFLVYDPLADGRRAGIATSPMWIPEPIVRRFAALLNTGSRLLGDGRAYAGFTRDTDPATVVRYDLGSRELRPYHLFRVRSDRDLARVREVPRLTGKVVKTLRAGDYYYAFQAATTAGAVWYGDRFGTRWVHSGNFE
jgi:hypothetical protein